VSDLFLALLHHPVLDRTGRIVTSAVTSLDIHDLARSAHTYGVRAVFLVHPVAEQREFARSVIDHWKFDYGRSFDSRRREALALVEIVANLDDALAACERIAGRLPVVIHTSAQTENGESYANLRARLEAADAPPALIVLGTGFGLAPEVRARADIVLAPILGAADYNHLSVRAAAAAILDRLRGR
jgi:hypothetical protein